MIVPYTEWQSKTEMVDPDQFWMDRQNKDALYADKYWHDCHENGESYCYGRNSIWAALYYGESGWFKMEKTWVPNDVWKKANSAFAKLIKFEL